MANFDEYRNLQELYRRIETPMSVSVFLHFDLKVKIEKILELLQILKFYLCNDANEFVKLEKVASYTFHI